MKKSVIKTLATAVVALAVATPAWAETVHTFTYDGGKKAEIYTSSQGVFVKTPVNNWDTKFEKGSSSSCEYKKHGSCYTKSQMIAEVESKTRSGEYWR
ncbi:hypothetical protein [Moraxella equi]|uniref:Uncharacterized protein n=1 Tax=Moraxella equi TaxID=60442 RepID=A0A378QRJ3_9GAMM|nr:hypothetical protein [Moraxella equi]OPH38007.1 hypothetical protein B5J93_07230 [Moraxella equi]STZ03509.1 Uncharacterised protein [Moraxella equi]